MWKELFCSFKKKDAQEKTDQTWFLLIYGENKARKKVVGFLTHDFTECKVSFDYGTGKNVRYSIVEIDDIREFAKYDKNTVVIFDLSKKKADLGVKTVRIDPGADDSIIRYSVQQAIVAISTLCAN